MPSQPKQQDAPAAAAAPKELKLLVVDDPAMSAAIEQLRAEWKARTGTSVEVLQATAHELIAAESLPHAPDAVIYPSRLTGTLAMRGWLARLPAEYRANRELLWGDTFELLQLAETAWAAEPVAVPFGSPVLTLYYRPDVLAALHRRPPRNWREYHELVELAGRRENLGPLAPPAEASWHGAAQPLAEGWASRTLLARAAPYVKHREHYSALFDIETMEPLIAGAGFVRALEELVADFRLGPPEQLTMDPDAVRAAFLAGKLATAITWPGHAATTTAPAEKFPPLAFAELPGADVVYNHSNEHWEKRETEEPPHVPLLAAAGRLGSITAQARQPQAALQFLAWLGGREWGAQVAGASPATTLYRKSQIRAPQPWVDRGTDADAAQVYATTVHDALNRQQYLSAPRIPGEAEYMAALDAAVRSAAMQEKPPAEALQAVADQWRAITEKLGVQAQRTAYRQSLGL